MVFDISPYLVYLLATENCFVLATITLTGVKHKLSQTKERAMLLI